MNPSNKSLRKFILLTISFIEGGSLMAAEIISARLLAPYFGSSLFVWSAVLAITLGGLAIGYFVGGVLSKRARKDLTLLTVVIYSAAALMTMPFVAQAVASMAYTAPFNQAVLTVTMFTILPPVIGMGMVSPLMIANLTQQGSESGKVSGTVYAISTCGGILFTFLFGFFIIPNYGLILPAIFTGLFLGLLPAVYLFKYGFKHQGILSTVFIGTLLLSIWQQKLIGANFDILYINEGILGQIVVADVDVYRDDYSKIKQRAVFINMAIQSSEGETPEQNYEYEYIKHSRLILESLPKNSNVLLLGLGGGALAKASVQAQHNTDVVELDERIIYVAREYFNLPDVVNNICQDARWYIRNSNKLYDAIVIDVFKGEDAPAHVFTIEAVNEIDKILNPAGVVVINTHGYYNGSMGKGNRSILKTLISYGYHADFLITHANEMRSSGLIVSGKQKSLYESAIPADVEDLFIDLDKIDLEDAYILTDSRPILDYLNMSANKEWRKNHLGYIQTFVKSRYIPLFH
ncbi:MAG: fused MFS/spermidine synthase [Flavobacteriales bacterium]